MQDLIKKYLDGLATARDAGAEIAKNITEALKPIIPDIEWSLGWHEAGIDTICFYSREYDVHSVDVGKIDKYDRLPSLIAEVFPELRLHVDTPLGIYIPKERCKEIIECLRKLKG